MLRLVGGRWGSFTFDKAKDADMLEQTCQSLWNKEANKGGSGLAPAIARLLATAASARERSRSRERSPPKSKRLLRRLSSVEVEGMWRLQHAEDLNAERSKCEAQQQEQIVQERIRRKMMTRSEFLESLQKEADMHRKIRDVQLAEEEERRRFEDLRTEEQQIFQTLKETEQQEPHDAECNDEAGNSLDAPETNVASEIPDREHLRPECCVICHDAQRCVVFLPCKHLVCCAECGHGAHRLAQCPMCRAKVVWRFKVFV